MLKRVLVSAGLALFCAPVAQAANHGWYWGIEIGGDQPGDISAPDPGAPFITETISFDTGAAGLVTLGGHLGPQLRLEGELGYRWDNLTGGARGWSEGSLMANVIYDMPLGDRLTGSIGAGVGADVISHGDNTSTGFAYQVIGGLAYSLSPATDLTVQYRFMSASGPTLVTGSGDENFDDLHHSSLTLGLRLNF